jgi:hypothetical protein
VLSEELNQAKSRLNAAMQPELHTVWNKGLALAAGSGASYDPDDLAGEWVIASDMSLSWDNYIKRKPGSVDPNSSSSVRVRFEKRGSDYVGIIIRQGMVPSESDAWTYESIGQNRRHVFRMGLEYLRLRKIGKNLFQGTLLGVGTPGDNRLTPNTVYIVVYDEAAKLLKQLSNMPQEVFTRENGQGKLMLRLGLGSQTPSPDMEAVGRHVFIGIEGEVPPGGQVVSRGPTLMQVGGVMAPSYQFRHRKPFRFSVSTDNNPGFITSLHYMGQSPSQLLQSDQCDMSPEHYGHVQDKRFTRHGGKGIYCLVTSPKRVRDPADQSLLSVLRWSKGEWAVTMWGHDYPNHPGTQFRGVQGQLNYMIRILDRLAPRLDTLPPEVLQGGNSPSLQTQPGVRSSSQPAGGGMNLLGIEAR